MYKFSAYYVPATDEESARAHCKRFCVENDIDFEDMVKVMTVTGSKDEILSDIVRMILADSRLNDVEPHKDFVIFHYNGIKFIAGWIPGPSDVVLFTVGYGIEGKRRAKVLRSTGSDNIFKEMFDEIEKCEKEYLKDIEK